MRKTIIPILFFIAALTLSIIPAAALSPTGLVLSPGYAVVCDDFYVPKHPEWFQPGVTIEGSKLALRDSDGTLYIVKGYSCKNIMPPWDAHSYIALVKHTSFGDQELAKVEVDQDRNYNVKIFFYSDGLVATYNGRVLGSFTARSSYLDVLAEGCTPRLEHVVGSPPGTPTVITSNELFFTLLGLGVLAITVAAIVIAKRR